MADKHFDDMAENANRRIGKFFERSCCLNVDLLLHQGYDKRECDRIILAHFAECGRPRANNSARVCFSCSALGRRRSSRISSPF
jgi:hypothetical protein